MANDVVVELFSVDKPRFSQQFDQPQRISKAILGIIHQQIMYPDSALASIYQSLI